MARSCCCQRLLSAIARVPATTTVHGAGIGVQPPIEPLCQQVAVFKPDRLAGIHEDRLIRYEVAPAINQREAISLFARGGLFPPGRGHPQQDRPSGRRAATDRVTVLYTSRLGSQRPTHYETKLRVPPTLAHGGLAGETPLGISRRFPTVRQPLADQMRTVRLSGLRCLDRSWYIGQDLHRTRLVGGAVPQCRSAFGLALCSVV